MHTNERPAARTCTAIKYSHAAVIIIIIIIIKTLFSVGNTISYKLLFLEAHLTKYIQTMKICKQNKARTHIQFVQIRH